MFRIDLKTFLDLLCLTNTLKLSESKYQAGFKVNNFGPKFINHHDSFPIYSTTVLYDSDDDVNFHWLVKEMSTAAATRRNTQVFIAN